MGYSSMALEKNTQKILRTKKSYMHHSSPRIIRFSKGWVKRVYAA